MKHGNKNDIDKKNNTCTLSPLLKNKMNLLDDEEFVAQLFLSFR